MFGSSRAVRAAVFYSWGETGVGPQPLWNSWRFGELPRTGLPSCDVLAYVQCPPGAFPLDPVRPKLHTRNAMRIIK